MKAVRMKVEGIVQGVGFRYYTYKMARLYGINGYVKNLPDGSVEVVAEGPDDKLEKFLQEVARGPSTAVVTNVTVEELSLKGFKTFKIEY